ncbi:MAG: hypothetical protein CMJ14_01005 [Pelagibacterales bacterium]|nr:hypothetical protein [Pelagibacterales bacterium]
MKYITIISLTLSILINNVFGQEEDIIKYRKNIMKAVGNHISIIAANLKGKVDINSDILPHSNALYLSLAAIDIDKTFPEGTSNTSGLKTKSLPIIWSDKKAFRESMKVSTEKAKALVIAAEGGNRQDIGKALGALGKTCGNCHNKFREKKN